MELRIGAAFAAIGLMGMVSVRAAELEVFDNGDFEASDRFGVQGKVEIARGYGFNGNGGARIRGHEKTVFKIPLKTRLQLKQGNRYVFSMDVRNNNDCRRRAGGALADQIALEVYDAKQGKFLESYYGCSYEDLDGGWRHERLSFVPQRDLDSEQVELRFFVLIEAQPRKANSPGPEEDYVDCDNARFESAEPIWRFCNTWPTHNRIWKETGRLRAYSSFVGPFLREGAKVEYELELIAESGKLLATAVPEEDRGVLTAAFGPIDHTGAATLAATIRQDGKVVARNYRAVTVTPEYRPQAGEIVVTESGVAMVDGKPFMPLGFYSHFSDRQRYTAAEVEGHFQRLQAAGFNLLVDYDTWTLKTKADRDWFYGLCEKYGLRVLAGEFASDWRNQSAIPQSGEKAKELAKYRPIIGWNLHDEARENGIPGLELSRRALNAVTPGHVTWGCNIFAPEPYLPTVDVQGGDDYPVRAGGGTLAGMAARMRAAAACRPALAWYAPQSFNWGNYQHGTDALTSKETYERLGREPTENEVLAGALTYASYGVSGFIFYSYYDIFKGPFPERPAQRWELLKRVAATMRSLEPFITSGRRIIELPHADAKDETRVVVLRDARDEVRVLVLGLGNEHASTFRLPTRFRALKSRCGLTTTTGNGYAFHGGAISGDVLE